MVVEQLSKDICSQQLLLLKNMDAISHEDYMRLAKDLDLSFKTQKVKQLNKEIKEEDIREKAQEVKNSYAGVDLNE